jgi:hypothetical protein
MQETKRQLASAALEGGKGAAKLSMADILALFRHDNHGPDIIDSTPTLGGMINLLDRGERSSQRSELDGREEYPLYARRW